MENDIGMMVAGYVAVRLGIVLTCAFLLYKFATLRKPVKVNVGPE